jgi:hypothetical protein
MVLISIQPFAFRKILLVIAAVVCFSAICLADPVLMVHRYAAPVEQTRAPRTAAQATQQPAGPDNGLAFPSRGSINSFGDMTELSPGQPGNMHLPPSFLPQAIGELRLTNFQAASAVTLFAMPDQE